MYRMRTGNWTDVVFCLQARLVPHVLADAFEGEIPLPPDSLAECGARAAHEERDNTVDSLAADYVQLAWGTARWVSYILFLVRMGN